MQLSIFGGRADEVSIERIRQFEPAEGYYVAFSGGKDSVVLLDLVRRAGVKHEVHYHYTTVDPPEVVRFVESIDGVIVDHPAESMWRLIARKGILPTRWRRFCCETLKEGHGAGRHVLTGVRWAESRMRATQKMVHSCPRNGKISIKPIIDWSTSDIWSYISERNLPTCSLYAEGFKRIGCVLCPLSSPRQAERDIIRWPKIAAAYRRATERMWRASAKLQASYHSSQDLWHWWLTEGRRVTKHSQSSLSVLSGVSPDAKPLGSMR